MKKSFILILFLTLFFSSMICFGQIIKSHAVEEANVDELQSLFASFYNNGVYVKDTEIYVNDNVKKEISYFHAEVNDLERTTYYNGNELWFSTGSGYGTNGENLTHFTVENGVKGTETVFFYLPGMEAYYCTLNDFVEGVHKSAHSNNVDLNLEKGWTLNDGVYSSSASDVLDAFRLFTAPLWLGKTAENANYIDYTKATVEVVGNSLVMKLWIDSTDAEGKLVLDAETDGANAVFSKAVIQPLSIWDGESVSESLDEVDGTLLIQSAADLAYVRASGDTFSGKTLQMTTSVYMKEANYMIEKMDGTFDGNGYSVRGLNISNTVANTGFVKLLASTGTVENLSVYGKVQGADIANTNTGAIVGVSSGKIINCHNYATVSAGTSASKIVGGIVGKTAAAGAHIINCTNNANVTANKQVGGIIGTLYLASNVISCTNNGDITSKGTDTGGIIGSLGGNSASIVKECVNNGNVTGTNVGGIVGVSYTKNNSIICCCVNTGIITSSTSGKKGDILGIKTTQANSTDFVYVTHEWHLVEEKENSSIYNCPCGEIQELEKVDIWDGETISASLEGAGTEENPYLIQLAADLAYFATEVTNGNNYEGTYLKLTSSLDLSNHQLMIGNDNNGFAGTFDGNGKTIRGMNISNSTVHTGLFSILNSTGTIKDLTVYGKVQGATIGFTGGIVGDSQGTINNCVNYATVSGGADTNNCGVGGIAGATGGLFTSNKAGESTDTKGGKVENCINYGMISGGRKTAGIVGVVRGSTEISGCVNNGNVSAIKQAGGICGTIYYSSNVTSCVNNGNITGTGNENGGIAGSMGTNSVSSITNCSNTGNVTGAQYIGGIVGASYSTKKVNIVNCDNSGTITGSAEATHGPIVGSMNKPGGTNETVVIINQ